MRTIQEIALEVFETTSNGDLIKHYNEILKELNIARAAMKYNKDIMLDSKFKHLVGLFFYQAIGAENEMVRRGLCKKEDLAFHCGDGYNLD